MFVIIKRGKKRIKVEVANKDCPLYTCFSPDKNGDGGYYCSYRDLQGCPDIKIKRNGKKLKGVEQYLQGCPDIKIKRNGKMGK